MGQEGESINKVKFQQIPESTNRERNIDPADSDKNVLPGMERYRSRLFSGFAD